MKTLPSLSLISALTFVAFGCADDSKKLSEPVQEDPAEFASDATLTDDSQFESYDTNYNLPLSTGNTYAELPSDSQVVTGTEEEGPEPTAEAEKEVELAANAPAPAAEPVKATLDPAEGTTRSSAQCSLGNDERKVSVVDKSEGGCGVNYEKWGSERQVAWANYDMAYCDEVSDRIQGNLTTAGFSCSGDVPELASAEEGSPSDGSSH